MRPVTPDLIKISSYGRKDVGKFLNYYYLCDHK